MSLSISLEHRVHRLFDPLSSSRVLNQLLEPVLGRLALVAVDLHPTTAAPLPGVGTPH